MSWFDLGVSAGHIGRVLLDLRPSAGVGGVVLTKSNGYHIYNSHTRTIIFHPWTLVVSCFVIFLIIASQNLARALFIIRFSSYYSPFCNSVMFSWLSEPSKSYSSTRRTWHLQAQHQSQKFLKFVLYPARYRRKHKLASVLFIICVALWCWGREAKVSLPVLEPLPSTNFNNTKIKRHTRQWQDLNLRGRNHMISSHTH